MAPVTQGPLTYNQGKRIIELLEGIWDLLDRADNRQLEDRNYPRDVRVVEDRRF